MSIFSLPTYPGAVSYNIRYSDPLEANPNQQNAFGPWTTLGSYTTTSNIYDSGGNQNLRLYQAQPVVSLTTAGGSVQSVSFPWYDPFSVEMSSPGVFTKRSLLYDPNITAYLPGFRDFVGDMGVQQTASTSINLDSGAGSGLLQPNGTQIVFNLADMPDAVPVIVLEYSVNIQKNGQTLVYNTDYIVNYDAGQVIFAVAPEESDSIDIFYTEVKYTNRVLNAALTNAVQRLAGLGINGYGVTLDNNVSVVTAPITSPGLAYIVFLCAQTIINNATIWTKAKEARSYKTADFTMDTAPTRLLDGMSAQTQIDNDNIRDAVDKYIRTATQPLVWGDFDSFLDTNGLIPNFSSLFILSQFSYWI